MANQEGRPRPLRVVAVDRRAEDLLRAYGEVFPRFGLEPHVVSDLPTWAGGHQAGVVVVQVTDTDDWRQLEQLTRSGSTIVALLLRSAPAAYRRAVLSGASGVAAVTDPPAHVARVIQAATANYALLPVAALRDEGEAGAPRLSDANKALLQGLAEGMSTEQLAQREGCSERTIYRRMRRLCKTLQVRNRDDAVAVARRLGLLNEVSH